MAKISTAFRDLNSRPHILYRFYDRTSVLLYVGITVDLSVRMADHARDKHWWGEVDRSATRIEYYDSRPAALTAEREAIRIEKPLHNDHHNESVELPVDAPLSEYSWDLEYFTSELLDAVSEEERDNVLADSETDFMGTTNSVADQRNQAAGSILMTIAWDRMQVKRHIDELYRYTVALGDSRFKGYLSELLAHRRKAKSYVSDYAMAAMFIRSFGAARAADYLDGLPGPEGDGWRECALAAGRKNSEDIERWSADYAILYKDGGWLVNGLCAGPSWRGSRCARTDLRTTTFEICPAGCPADVPCEGHNRWCDKHTNAAMYGRLELLADDPWAAFPIKGARTPLRANGGGDDPLAAVA